MFYCSFVVFAITLLLTKSKILACKRQFVEKRYKAAFVNNQKPNWVHRIWNAIWTCPMCSGFWISLLVCTFLSEKFFLFDVFVSFGLNWIYHCFENFLFQSGKIFERFLNDEI